MVCSWVIDNKGIQECIAIVDEEGGTKYFRCVEPECVYNLLIPLSQKIPSEDDYYHIRFVNVREGKKKEQYVADLVEYERQHSFVGYEKETPEIVKTEKTNSGTVLVTIEITNEKGKVCGFCGLRQDVETDKKIVKIEFIPVKQCGHIHFYPINYDIADRYVVKIMYDLENLVSEGKLQVTSVVEYDEHEIVWYGYEYNYLIPKGVMVKHLFQNYSKNPRIYEWQKKAELIRAIYDYLREHGYELMFSPREKGVMILKDGKPISEKSVERQAPTGIYGGIVDSLYYMLFFP